MNHAYTQQLPLGQSVSRLLANKCRPPCAFKTSAYTKCYSQTSVAEQREIAAEQQPSTAVQWQGCVALAAAGILAVAPMAVLPEPAFAADTVKVGTCLLQKCQLQLAQCLGDAKCLQNIVCLNQCNTAEDEAACQIRCGDLYGDKAVDTFNACAVSDQKCVPQRQDEGLYPVPPDCALDEQFDLNMFTGRWYITAGLNPLFDIFDCQEHFFAVPEPGRLAAKINWRINKPDGDFIERSTIQTFVQDTTKPGVLYNHGNEYLHYQDDWYILGSKADDYVVIYYKGSNDAWDGYGGATVYTRARQLPEALVPELTAAVEKVGLKWSDFTVTDNSCKPHPPQKSLVEELETEADVIEKDIEGGIRTLGRGVTKLEKRLESELTAEEKGLEASLRSFGKGFTVLEQELETELTAEEQAVQREIQAELKAAEKLLAKVEREVVAEEQSLQKGLASALQQLVKIFKQ